MEGKKEGRERKRKQGKKEGRDRIIFHHSLNKTQTLKRVFHGCNLVFLNTFINQDVIDYLQRRLHIVQRLQ